MTRVGVIGLGWMGRVHLRNYTEMPGVDVAGVVDTSPEALDAAREQFGVDGASELAWLLDKDLDAVSVCVPTSLHHEVGLACIERGVPLLMEKPLAATVPEGEELVSKARAKGLPLMVGHIERFNPAVQRVKELLDDSEVISVQIERVGPYPPRIQDVGVIKDLGSHDIDLLRFFTGSEFADAFAVTSTTIGKHEDTALITARMDNGVLGNINTNWVTPYKSRRIHASCRDKYVTANLITQEVKEYSQFSTYDKSYSVREWPLVYREPVRTELTAFLKALSDGVEVPITGEDGLAVIRLIEKLLD